MKRICFVADSFFADERAVITGPQVQIYRLGQELLRRGWNVQLVAFAQSPVHAVESHNGVTIHWIAKRKWMPILSAWRLVRTLVDADPDVYYQRGRDVITGITAVTAFALGKRFVWATAGESGVERGKYWNQGLRKSRPIPVKVALLLEAVINDWLTEFGIGIASHIVVQTHSQKRNLLLKFGVSSSVVQSGHLIQPLQQRPEIFTVLWIGSIKPVKRPERFLELAAKCDRLSIKFVMAGAIADPSFGDVFQAQLSQSRVEYRGPVPFEESDALIGSAHVVVNTTDKDYEGLPNSFVQAWLAGTLAFSTGTDPDGIIGRNSLGIVADDLDLLAEALHRLVDDRSEWQRMSEATRDYAVRHFSIEAVVDRLEGFLTDRSVDR